MTALLLLSCGKEDDASLNQLNSGDPVVTADVKEVTISSALLYGYVNTEYLLLGGECGFIVSTSSTPSLDNGLKVVSSEVDKNGKFFVQVNGLLSSTKYYYKAFLNTGTTNLVGEIRSFTTNAFEFAAIDMGLSVKWANANLGAGGPEGYGDYYAWGETETKDSYSWETYKWCNGDYNKLTKYNNNNSFGVVDNKTVLAPEDDVAHVKLGGNWRMPTDEEWKELIDNCTWTKKTQNGIKGLTITSNKNGKSIFLPAAGYRNEARLSSAGSCGYYWSSSLDTGTPDSAWGVDFNTDSVYRDDYYRCYGRSVRPVTE